MHVHRDHQIDDRVLAGGCKPGFLDLDPAIAGNLTDRVVVELTVATIMQRHAGDERPERKLRPGKLIVTPVKREHRRQPRMLCLRVHHLSPGRPKHSVTVALRRQTDPNRSRRRTVE